ncbi:hypothetical protein ACIQVO_38360 [Streptomyces sp. NPDC101062]|uniref:hypothetical protein n=1 Tax=unclassified Streptomyces TaxID=2593676 RepID=UPI00381DFAB1
MTSPSPAGELRAAATRLRSLDMAATPGNWRAEELPPNEDHRHPVHWVKTARVKKASRRSGFEQRLVLMPARVNHGG